MTQKYGIDVTILYGSIDCNEKINNKYSFLCGKYPALDKENLNGSECDLVMQDRNTFFFEVKKASITNELENVDDVTMLQQLAWEW